tara:strand:- start:4327 stop:5850 length:1524 start_codon:yes stop_codon:yes gene_type:complete
MNNKILKTEKDFLKLKKLKNRGKKIGLCHGVFDLLHIGHINHFLEAKKKCDILVVSLTKDEFINKGPNRPVFKIDNRVKFLSNIACLDYICVANTGSALDAIKNIRPNYYFKGPDYKDLKKDVTGKIYDEINLVKKNGGEVLFTETEIHSSSKILNENFKVFSKPQDLFLRKIRKKFNLDNLIEKLSLLQKIKVHVVGEVIIDQYIFTNAIGKSGKEPVLMLNELNSEKYLGGSAAIAINLAGICKSINLSSIIGEKNDQINFIRSKLPKNIQTFFVNKKNSPTILKTRFVDKLNSNKIFGTYKFNDDLVNSSEEKKLINYFNILYKKIDLIIVSDYGHGMISEKYAKIICNSKKFTALNAQINAANIGYHGLQKYKNLDFIIVNESELRHELRSRHENIKNLMIKLSQEKNIKYLTVTSGKSGALLYQKNKNKFYYCPAFASKIIDKIGSGDTMLAVMSLCLKEGIDEELSLFLGSLAAAHSVENFANKSFFKYKDLIKSVQHILK